MKIEFPRLVFKSAQNYICVSNDSEFDAALSEGWFENVPDALQAAASGEPTQEVEVKVKKPHKAPAASGEPAGWSK